MLENLFDIFDNILYKCWNFKTRCQSNFAKTEVAKKNGELKNKYKGQRCFIVGNGPSIRNQNLRFLKDEIVFVTNDFWRYDGYSDVCPDYYCLFDPICFDLKMKDLNMPLIDGINELQKYEQKPQFIVLRKGKEVIEDYYHWNQWASIYYVEAILHYTEKYSKEYDITQVVPGVRCVVQYAMLLAAYMGFDKIYLLGIEQTNIIDNIETYLGKDATRYAFEISDEKSKEMCNISKRCTLEKLLSDYTCLFHHYKLVYDYCIKRDIDVYNCTPESLVDCIPRMQYESLFKDSAI